MPRAEAMQKSDDKESEEGACEKQSMLEKWNLWMQTLYLLSNDWNKYTLSFYLVNSQAGEVRYWQISDYYLLDFLPLHVFFYPEF